MNKKQLPRYDFETLFGATDHESLKDWLDNPKQRKGKVFKLPVTFTLTEGIGELDKGYIGFEDPRTAEAPTELDFSDSRMGMGLEMQIRSRAEAEDGLKRAWLIGTWETERVSFFGGGKLTFFVSQVKRMEADDVAKIYLGTPQ